MKTYPLTKTQMGIYAATVNAQEEGNYNIDSLYTLDADVDLERLARAVDVVIAAHPAVKARLATNDEGDVVLVDHAEEAFATTITDVDDINSVSLVGKKFDLMVDRLFRVEIYRTPVANYLYACFHHVIFDGMSMVTFGKEVGMAYDGETIENENITAFQLGEDEQAARASEAYAEAKAWYQAEFAAASGIDSLPKGDVAEKMPAGHAFVEMPVGVSCEAVATFCETQGVKESTLFTSAFAFLLSKYSGNKEVVFSTIYHGRPERGSRRAFGMMVKTLPVYADFGVLTTTKALVGKLSQQSAGSRQRTCYSFSELNADLGVTADICFAYQGTLNNYQLALGGKVQHGPYIHNHRPGIKFNVHVVMQDGKYALRVEYPTDRFTSEFIEGLGQSYTKVLTEMLTKEELKGISIVSDEQQRVLDGFHCTAEAEVPYKRFYEPIEHYAEATPDAVALVACDRTLTYGQFNAEANRIAYALMQRGVQRGDRVVLLLPRTSAVLCCMFGVSKAGAAYIPCDPAYPADRINLILEDSEAKYVITTAEHMAEHADKAILVDDLLATAEHAGNPAVAVSGDDLAYLIYTSGSTGRPKGVMLRHEAICNYLYNHEANVHIHAIMEEQVKAYLCITTLSFDMSLKEFGVALHNGLTCVLANEEETENPVLLANLMLRNHVDCMNGTPSRLLGYMEIPEFAEAVTHLKVILSGGEKYSPVLLDQLHATSGLRIFNTYGPTEITVSSNGAELTHTNFVTIGRPLLNYHEWVVDADGNELPVGVVGELLIGGIGVAKGYNNLPEKTAAAFIEYGGMRVYKSGDYARWTADGKVEVLGRMDGQIKLHGLRIEIGEIESCINQYPGIKQSLVKVCQKNGDEFLAAYFTAENEIDIAALKAEISKTLTHYMVPAALMQLDAFPLTPNGKTDVKNLPVPEMQHPASEGPKTPVTLNILEQQIKDIVAPVINAEEFGIDEPLSAYGLTSLSAIKLATLIYKHFGIQIKPQRLVKEGTLQMVENEILAKLLTAPEKEEKPVETAAPQGASTLTFAQTGVYYDIVKNPGMTAYNMPTIYSFPAGVTANMVAESLKAVMAAHPILGTHFEIDGNDVVQVRPENFEPQVELATVATEKEFEQLKADFIKPFNPAKGPLYRAQVVTAPDGCYLLLDTLHLVMDGASKAIFNRQLAEALEGTMPVGESYSYFDYAVDEKASVETPEYKASEAFFNEQLCTVEGVSNITEDKKAADDEVEELRYADCIVSRRPVQDAAKALGVTPAHLFLAAANYTVSRYTNSSDVCLCTISNGRSNLRVSDTVGMFVNTIALTSHITDVAVREFVVQTADTFTASLEHENYPFAQVAAKFDFAPDIFFQYQVGIRDRLTIKNEEKGIAGDLKFGSFGVARPKFKFTISIEDAGDDISIQIQYNSTLYTAALAEGFAEAMATVLHNFIAAPDARLKSVSMVGESQKALIASFHETQRAEVPILLYHKLFEKSVSEHAAERALVALNPYTGIYDTFTYASLNEHMNRIAHALMSRGVKRGDRIALLLPRTSRLIMCQYAVLKAGGAYIPCDPKYPTERINLILEDSEAPFIITTADRLEEFPGRAIDVETLLECDDASNPEVAVEPDDLAYLIYTSGSTGRPKGVQLMHKGVCNYHHPQNIIQSCLKNECHAALGITTISFDMSVWETGSPLMLGKTLVLVGDDDCNDPNRLAMLINDYGVDCMTATTSRFMQLLESPAFEEAFSNHIHLAYQGGEGLSMALLNKLQTYPNVRIFNGYGPTETIANSHASELTHDHIPHIGKPCVNYTNFIVDNDGNELPVGVVGELVIGGRSVAKWYNNLPEQTAARFVDYQGARVYKSGDYARWLPDGNVMVLGRKDNQVKLRGLRIELGEVESAITKVEGVKNVAVMIKKLAGKDHLCAYFTADRPIAIDDMKAEISKTLTHYMVPSAYLQMDAFPLTPNGKTDVKHLPEPELAKVGGDYVAPKNKAEEDFCGIFGTILELDKVSAADSFFDLGGSSLTATRVVIEATNLGYTVSYAEVFKNPTAQQLAKLVLGETTAEDPDFDPEVTDYDYTKINNLLAENNLEAFRNGERLALGDVVLTGANGYLGIHILHELLETHLVEHPACKVYCLVRHGRDGVTSEARLKGLLFYYFEKSYNQFFGKQLVVIDGDVTNPKAFDAIPAAPADAPLTLINCAAIVKHFSKGTEIEDINVGGLQNCVDFCLRTGSRLIQTSTGSTAGQSVNDNPSTDTLLTEQTSYIGQHLRSKYAHSKFLAERIVLEAVIEKGLVAKVMRLGNLSPRTADGEFQINFRSNSSMGRLHIFQMLGAISYGNAEGTMEFSPIDEVAHAILMLSTTPKACVVFHPVNNHRIILGDVVQEMARTLGISISEVEEETFQNLLQEAGKDPEKANILQSMLAYAGGKDKLVYLQNDNSYTNRVLARLGFRWNVTSWDYVSQFIRAIASLDFFSDKR